MILYSLDDITLINALRSGAVGVIPTDTIYGIVACATDPSAVARLYSIKHREGKPGTVIAANVQQLIDLGIDEAYLAQVADLWPNPLSVVLPDHPALAYLDQGKHSLAVRVPADETVTALLLLTGPLLTSSANMPGEPAATTLDEARAYFGDSVDFYVDGGSIADATPSTIIRITERKDVEVLRRGAIELQ